MTHRIEPGFLLAQGNIGLQNAAGALSLWRDCYDLCKYLRRRLEAIDLAPNRRANCFFIHVPNCGETSVENQRGTFHDHRSAIYFRAADRAVFDAAFKFALVRNPYDRLVSRFHFLKYHTPNLLSRAWVARYLAKFDDFRAFAKALEEPAFARRMGTWKHFVPQWYFLCDRNGTALVDHVGRLERFDDFIAEVARRSPLRLGNEVHRASERLPWQDYYSERARRCVAEIYRDDFRIFGYPE